MNAQQERAEQITNASENLKSVSSFIAAQADEIARLQQERDAWKDIVLSFSPDGWLQNGMYEECIADCGNEPSQGHADDCKFVAALRAGEE